MKTRKLKIKSFLKYLGANVKEAINQDGGISPIGFRCYGDIHSFGDSGSQRTAMLINSKRFLSVARCLDQNRHGQRVAIHGAKTSPKL